MSYYFNTIHDFLTFTIIMFLYIYVLFSKKGFFVTVKSVAYVLFYLFFDTFIKVPSRIQQKILTMEI